MLLKKKKKIAYVAPSNCVSFASGDVSAPADRRNRITWHGRPLRCILSPLVTRTSFTPQLKCGNTATGGGSGSIGLRSATKSAAGRSVGRDNQASDGWEVKRHLSLSSPSGTPMAISVSYILPSPIVAGLEGGKGAKKSSTLSQSLWFASNPSKRWGEVFFLLYTPFWLTLTIGIVVPYKIYERFTELEYLLLGLVSAVPAFLIPLFVVGEVHTLLPALLL